LAASHQALHHGGEFRRFERFADHPRGGKKDLSGLVAGGLGGDLGRKLGRGATRLPSKCIGVARIDHERAGRGAVLQAVATPIDRR